MKSETPFVGRYTIRQAVANVLAGCGRLLHERIILVLALMFCTGVAGVLWQVSRVQSNLIAAIGLGEINKFLEPLTGAVLGKIFVLIIIILFIQKRPRGLFALKGRAVET